ncbi:MAG: energy transducer TonB, partial [Myxococcota bacterium]
MNGNQQQPRSPGGKPGAMTMAMRAVQQNPSGPKVLRIGLIQDGKIVEERIVRRRETVSVGTSERNHFIVQAPGLPNRFDVFELVGNDYILNFTDAMTGKVALPGGVQDLDTLRKSGGARNAGNKFQVKLTDSSRGKVVIGRTTVLFQFVVPPPVQPRPQLPAAARGGLVAGIDWLFTAFVVFSYMIFFGFIVYLESADWPIRTGIASVPEEYMYMFDEPPPPPEEPDEQTTEEVTDEAVEDEADDAPTQTPSKNQNNANNNNNSSSESNAEASARIAQEARQSAEALLLGALGDGALANVLAEGAHTGNAAEVLAQAEGVGVAQNAQATLMTRTGGGGSGQQGGLGQLAAAGGG